MSVVNLKVLMYINMCCILPDDRQIANEVLFFVSVSYQHLLHFLLRETPAEVIYSRFSHLSD